jgi:hypothetical protein
VLGVLEISNLRFQILPLVFAEYFRDLKLTARHSRAQLCGGPSIPRIALLESPRSYGDCNPRTLPHFDTIALMRKAVLRPQNWKACDCPFHHMGNSIHIVPCCEGPYLPKGKSESPGKRRWPNFRSQQIGGRANVP